MVSTAVQKLRTFQSTPSVRRETDYGTTDDAEDVQFQSTPSVRRETAMFLRFSTCEMYFNPLPPCGGRRDIDGAFQVLGEFQSTPSVRRETLENNIISEKRMEISIHSLRAEGDHGDWLDSWDSGAISIHSLRAEGDYTVGGSAMIKTLFQSTPSVRRET